MSAVAELENGLNVMLNLKPPGVTGSQIKAITALCNENVKSESVLIQKMFTHFKKTPGTHKLGVLYVVDSVTRRWIESAKSIGQPITSTTSEDGTYAAGVLRITELLPVLMNDILQSAPPEQKEKIKKLVDIWEKGQTFPAPLIESFKQKLSAPSKGISTTPNGTPPPGPGLPGLPLPGSGSDNKGARPNAIMEALANIARQNTNNGPMHNALPAQETPYGLQALAQQPPAQQQPPLPVTQSQPAFPFAAAPPPPVNAAPVPYAYPQQGHFPGVPPALPVTASSQPNGFPAGPMPGQGQDPAAFAQQVQFIKLLMDQGIPADKIPALLATLQNGAPAMPPAASAPPAFPQQGQTQYPGAWGPPGPRPEESRDHTEYNGLRSPNRYRNRSRSRSPARNWGSRDSPRGRDDRGFDAYGRESPGRGHDRRADYRQRSPAGYRQRSPSPGPGQGPNGQKWVEIDRTLPAEHIKVLSRTLFVGGVTCSEAELRDMFSQHGQVQTCIVNKDKRHAFVKMINRKDAVRAKEGMESSQYRTRWGVGFGPRDCSDYQTGISVIPISRLTEADRKWMLTAEYGGSGGRPIETGLVVEEPDIEIGAGVSSKAISRRMQTDRSGRHGPKSSRSGDDEPEQNNNSNNSNGGRWARKNKDNRRDERRDDRAGPEGNVQPVVADFPYGITTGPNGMPVFPPGFTFPAPN